MREARFSVGCIATYKSTLEIPDSVQKGKELEYIRDHMSEFVIEDLEWLEDLEPSEAITEDDIMYIV